MVYLDNAASTEISEENKKLVVEGMENWGNGSGRYSVGRMAGNTINECRDKIATSLNAEGNIYFTSGATESNNWVAHIVKHKLHGCGICGHWEHKSVLKPFTSLSNSKIISNLNLDDIEIELEQYSKSIHGKPFVFSCMLINNITGKRFEVEYLAKVVHKLGGYIHVDGTQAIGKVYINLSEMGIDYFTCSGHKIHAPKGIGMLYVADGAPLCPFIYGGSQEYKMRAGTENLIGITTLANSIITYNTLDYIVNSYTLHKKLSDKLQNCLAEEFTNFLFNTNFHICNLFLEGVTGETLQVLLDMKDIAVSTGSACNSNGVEIEPIIIDMKVPKEYNRGMIRISFGDSTTEEDIDKFISALKDSLIITRGYI